MSAVTLDGVSVRRDRRTVLDGVDLAFATGRLTVVIGPNGAGKSTLLMLIAGLLRADHGQVRVDDRQIAAIDRRTLARNRAYLPQSPMVDWPISVRRLVALGLTPVLPAFGRLPDNMRERVDAALAAHDLTDLAERPATALSGGELTRAMLARATVGDPALLIVDEPTTGLDPRHALDAAARLRARVDAGRTVIVALHDLDLASRIADDVVALKDGRVVGAGPAERMVDEALLADLYDVRVAITRDGDRRSVRFG